MTTMEKFKKIEEFLNTNSEKLSDIEKDKIIIAMIKIARIRVKESSKLVNEFENYITSMD